MSEAVEETTPDDLVDIYARKSVKLAGRRGELSPNAQIQRGRDWASWNKLRVRHVWQDTLSASKDVKRPDYEKALLALANGEIKTLWCYKLDRFSRKGALAVLNVLEHLGETGARIIFGEDGLDSSDPNHRRMIMWKAEDARDESLRISQRVTDTKAWQRDHGEWVTGKTPYGLVADEARHLVPDTRPAIPGAPEGPTRARVAQSIFVLAALGLSLRAITRALHRYGIPSPTGKPAWAANTVYRIITNPAYSGWQVHCVGKQRGVIYVTAKGKRVRVGEPLVSDDRRKRAVRALKGHSKPKAPYAGKAAHLLTGLTQCTCGRSAPMSSTSYTCTTALDSGATCENPASVFRPPLEKYVVECWLARLTNADAEDPLLAAVASRWAALTKPNETAELAEAIAVLKSAEAIIERLLRDRRAGLYEGPAARFFEPAYEEVMADYNAASLAVRKHGGSGVDISFLLDEESAREAWEDADTSLRRDLLRLAIDRVIITRAGSGNDQRKFNGDTRVTIKWAG
ncbi:recombinase family protein [Streptomyces sp. SDr-06]|uniref:recombinase family protein n=1 Tax=Streptomyces sp. SDr-06 TaxID=2267702 RepID=UPI000DE8C383|nr:recombinase family protein [Streptomyces sp. SDr-06]